MWGEEGRERKGGTLSILKPEESIFKTGVTSISVNF